MNGKEYQEACLRTAADDDQIGRLVNCALGLAGETGELAAIIEGPYSTELEPLISELGDLWWYTAMAQHALGYCDLDLYTVSPTIEDATVFAESERVLNLVAATGAFADRVKKVVFQGHPLETHEEKLKEHIADIVQRLADIGKPQLVWEKNIEKLRKRYPEGFSEERSLHREL